VAAVVPREHKSLAVAATPAAQGLLVCDLYRRSRPTDVPDTVMIIEELSSGHVRMMIEESEGMRRLLLGSAAARLPACTTDQMAPA
jgi:hypothetical protein